MSPEPNTPERGIGLAFGAPGRRDKPSWLGQLAFMVAAWPTSKALCRRASDWPSVGRCVLDGFCIALIIASVGLTAGVWIMGLEALWFR